MSPARFMLLALMAALAACTSGDDEAQTPSPSTSATAEATSTLVPPGPEPGPVAPPVRHPAVADPIYFVMTDRFANGDHANDTGGIEGGPLEHGFLPTDRAYHQGGDLAGLTERLDYIAELGMGAIWITPPFTNSVVQGDGTIEGSSSGYHGYWQIDWDRVDPHLGTEDDMQTLITAAHDRGIKVYFDIVVNHTGDEISYAEGSQAYVPLATRPYTDADGRPLDPEELAGADQWPELDPASSFPYTPVADPTAKSPDWLNDLTLYHNRGNSTFQGESSLYGDFFGLDDLFTEHPTVVREMSALQASLIERYDIDGFRVDTMKHVGLDFWRSFVPVIDEAAAAAGKDEFFWFGEVFSSDPILGSSFTLEGVPATLDFIVDEALDRYVARGGDGEALAAAFDTDDWFTDADGNASSQVTFFGNHDEGRMGRRIVDADLGAGDEERLARMRLGFDLLFSIRGVPVVYYGDEQGFVGDGRDQLARAPMFPTQVPDYVDDDNIGSDATPADDNFDPDHPLYRHVVGLAEQRRSTPALTSGAQIVHEAQGPVFAFSRIERNERIEHLVITNSATSPASARVTSLTPSASFTPLDTSELDPVESGSDGLVELEIPGLSRMILVADRPVPVPTEAAELTLIRPEDGARIPTPRYRIEAELGDARLAEVTFAVSIEGAPPEVVGVDDAPPYRLYWSNAAWPAGTEVELIATADDGSGRLASDRVTVTLGDRGMSR